MQYQPPRRDFPMGSVRLSPKRVLFGILLLLAIIFAVQNSQRVELSVFFWEFRLRLVWVLLIFGLIGAILGWMVPRLRAGRRRQGSA
jgi:uncharacterized integral membrane protein